MTSSGPEFTGKLKFIVTTTVEKWPSDEAYRRGDPPEVVEKQSEQMLTAEQARMLGFTEEQIQEAINGNHT